MGCDIHLKLEKRLKTSRVFLDDNEKIREAYYESMKNKWYPCEITRRHCWGERIYGMFAKLANVRNYWPDEIKPLEVRGFPEDANDNTLLAYCFQVIPDDEYEENIDRYDRLSAYGDEHYCGKSQCDRWVENGSSKVMGEKFGRTLISGPDWHSASWCTAEEMKQAVKDVFYHEGEGWKGEYIEWLALAGAMEAIESDGNYECRAVFWFDS